ncbi:hypothetical protein EDD86DRAFT_204773 [Gorgonomyces haynaldii]|nr:hypothetical protein EDD86DRAFT_204773 [Gorgonomyces haynaldii]
MPAPCRFYALGQCRNGRNCTFSHEDSASTICQFYVQGNCRFGNRCELKHIKPKQQKEDRKLEAPKIVKPVTVVFDQEDKRQPLCPFEQKGECRMGSRCKYLHGGIVCKICQKPCIHPQATAQEIQAHESQCTRIQEKSDVECSICLEPIGKKKDPRFGLLECDHCACLECIRKWRGHEQMNTSKQCPICRTITYAVTPSAVWPRSKAEKEEIIQKYRESLKKINCKFYDFGNGTCPFGTSCFYKHADKFGNLEQVKLRHLATDDEVTTIMKHVSLSDYL